MAQVGTLLAKSHVAGAYRTTGVPGGSEISSLKSLFAD
jgi:hypothetical protein